MAEKVKVSANLKINGKALPFKVLQEEETLYREAARMINERLAELNANYGANVEHSNDLLGVVAIEALVDALKVNHKYQLLQLEVEKRLDEIETKLHNSHINLN